MPSKIEFYKAGDHWNICQRCGKKIRRSETYIMWNGLKVCKEDYEPRHPQDFVSTRKEDMSAQAPVTGEPATTYVVQTEPNAGDADLTLTWGVSLPRYNFATDLTANRTVTLNTSGATFLATFRIERSGGGAYTIDVGGLYTFASGATGYCEVQYNGTAWELFTTGTL